MTTRPTVEQVRDRLNPPAEPRRRRKPAVTVPDASGLAPLPLGEALEVLAVAASRALGGGATGRQRRRKYLRVIALLKTMDAELAERRATQ